MKPSISEHNGRGQWQILHLNNIHTTEILSAAILNTMALLLHPSDH